MPYLKIQTNQPVPDTDRESLLKAASQLIARLLGKPEAYVTVALEPGVPMCFAGSTAPTAFLECKSIGLPTETTAVLSDGLCAFVEAELSIPTERVYIEFASATGKMWGWNRATF